MSLPSIWQHRQSKYFNSMDNNFLSRKSSLPMWANGRTEKQQQHKVTGFSNGKRGSQIITEALQKRHSFKQSASADNKLISFREGKSISLHLSANKKNNIFGHIVKRVNGVLPNQLAQHSPTNQANRSKIKDIIEEQLHNKSKIKGLDLSSQRKVFSQNFNYQSHEPWKPPKSLFVRTPVLQKHMLFPINKTESTEKKFHIWNEKIDTQKDLNNQNELQESLKFSESAIDQNDEHSDFLDQSNLKLFENIVQSSNDPFHRSQSAKVSQVSIKKQLKNDQTQLKIKNTQSDKKGGIYLIENFL